MKYWLAALITAPLVIANPAFAGARASQARLVGTSSGAVNPADEVGLPVLPPRITVWGATWRSAIIPGWGQGYRGQAWLGWTYFGSVAVTTAMAQYFNFSGDATFESYKSTRSATDATNLYNQTIQQDQLYSIFGYTALGLYAWNVLDALIFTNPSRTSQGSAWMPGLDLMAAKKNSLGFSIRWQL